MNILVLFLPIGMHNQLTPLVVLYAKLTLANHILGCLNVSKSRVGESGRSFVYMPLRLLFPVRNCKTPLIFQRLNDLPLCFSAKIYKKWQFGNGSKEK